LSDDPIVGGVTQVRAFTGSSFRADGAARPLMRLDTTYELLMPEVAWQFDANTPRLPGDGRLQGAALEIGRGRVAVFAEAAMFTAQVAGAQQTPTGLRAPGAEQNKQFVLNVVRWLAGAP
jgi:hypothetical protein